MIESKLKQMIDECFKITLNLDMLEQEQIDKADIVIINKPKGRTEGGHRNGKLYLRINIENIIIHSPDTDLFFKEAKSKREEEQFSAVRAAQKSGKFSLMEYTSFWKDKGIGLWVGNSEDGGWRVVVAHEMAHVVGFNSNEEKWQDTRHGPVFKKVYRILRKKMLSDIL